MNTIWTVFKKELLDTLRDRKTLGIILLLPLFLIPTLSFFYGKFVKSQSSQAMEKNLKVAIFDNNNGEELIKRFTRRRDLEVVKGISMDNYKEMIREDSLDLALIIDSNFDADIANGKTGKVDVHYNSTEDGSIYDRFESTLLAYHKEVLDERLDQLSINQETIEPLMIKENDVYSRSESLGKMIGGFLPYLFVLFSLMGVMYPAIDLFTGEKERGTIETILSVPVARINIMLGKMLVITLTGVLSAVLTILGAYIALNLNGDLPPAMVSLINHFLEFKSMAIIISMLIPLSAFFAGVIIPLCIYSRSFKEAQSLIQPLTFFIIFPLLIAAYPSVELNYITAMIPVVNIALVTKEVVAGTLDYQYLFATFASLFFFAIVSILFSVRYFEKESSIFRM